MHMLMMIAIIFLLVCTLLLKNVNGAISFDTYTFALAHPCVWSTCESLPSEEQNYTISCCTLQVPLNYAQPNETKISISMVRLSPSNLSNNFLFVLNGGPGEAGLGLLSIIIQLIPVQYGLTVIVPDHRGTGFSTLLSCDDQNSQDVTIDCITYLKDRWTINGLHQFSTTSAAHDLAIQIQAAQLTGRISILGVSYGTYWLNRFLTIYPNLVQAAVMDSPVHPLLHSFSMYNIRASSMALQFLTYCHYQIECIQHFPNSSPVIMLYQILQEIDLKKQKCINTYFSKYNLTSQLIKKTFFYMVQSASNYYDRTLIPAIIYRINRCNKDDVAALDFFFQSQNLSPSLSSNESSSNDTNMLVLNSDALYHNIAFSELWLSMNQSDVDQQTLNTWQNATIIAPDLRSDLVALKQAWPKYSLDEYRYRLANSSVLMLVGQLDAATSLDFASNLASTTGNTRTLYSIPLSGHITLLYLLTTEYMCPLHLILGWTFPALFPSEWNDPICLQNLPTTIDFVGTTEMVQMSSFKLLNVSLPFGNTSTSQMENRASSSYSTTSLIFILCLIYNRIYFYD